MESKHTVASGGDFLANTRAWHADTTGKNFISIVCNPYASVDSGAVRRMDSGNAGRKRRSTQKAMDPLWIVEFYICRRNDTDNERWAWGVQFLMTQRDRRIVPGSVKCLVAG